MNDGKVQYRRIRTTCGIDVSDRTVGCAEVNSDEEVAHGDCGLSGGITPSSRLDSSRVSTAQVHLFPDTEAPASRLGYRSSLQVHRHELSLASPLSVVSMGATSSNSSLRALRHRSCRRHDLRDARTRRKIGTRGLADHEREFLRRDVRFGSSSIPKGATHKPFTEARSRGTAGMAGSTPT